MIVLYLFGRLRPVTSGFVVKKQVLLSIDTASWTNAVAAYRRPYPSAFPSGGVTEVDFYGSLLQVGMLTIPWRGAAYSLAAYWAYVRYCDVIDSLNPVLRLMPEWSDLDSYSVMIGASVLRHIGLRVV